MAVFDEISVVQDKILGVQVCSCNVSQVRTWMIGLSQLTTYKLNYNIIIIIPSIIEF